MDFELLNDNEPWHLTDTFTERRYRQMLIHVSSHARIFMDFGIGGGRGGESIRKEYPNSFLIGVDNVKNRLALETSKVYDQLIIADDGVGFDPQTIKKGMGLKNMRSRAELLSGKIDIISTPGKGSKIKVILPIN